MAKTERLQLRVSAEMKEQLERLAAADGRSVTNYIEHLIRKALAQEAAEAINKAFCDALGDKHPDQGQKK